MKEPKIEAKAKDVEIITLADGLIPTRPGIDRSLFASNIADIRARILAGHGLPDHYYRRSTGRDYLLEDRGWMHLHVGHDVDDDVLLVVEQTEDQVIFIALTNHEIFQEDPRGKSLSKLGSKVAAAKLKRAGVAKPKTEAKGK